MLRWTKGKKERERSSKSWGQDHSRGSSRHEGEAVEGRERGGWT